MRTLTPRELDVLRRIIDGASEKIAARDLGMSVNTVQDRTASIRLKLGARTTLQAAAKAVRAGLV